MKISDREVLDLYKKYGSSKDRANDAMTRDAKLVRSSVEDGYKKGTLHDSSIGKDIIYLNTNIQTYIHTNIQTYALLRVLVIYPVFIISYTTCIAPQIVMAFRWKSCSMS